MASKDGIIEMLFKDRDYLFNKKAENKGMKLVVMTYLNIKIMLTIKREMALNM